MATSRSKVDRSLWAMRHGQSVSTDYETPWPIFRWAHARYGLEHDICATRETAKLESYWTAKQDAFKFEWKGRLWMNPPYGPGGNGTPKVYEWIKRAHDQARKHPSTLIVCLLPCFTDVRWWHEFAIKASDIIFVEGRIRFLRNGIQLDTMPAASVLVIFNHDDWPAQPRISSMWAGPSYS
jgi:hypothetical protein